MKNKKETIKAYKVFDKDWKCRDFQFKVGKTFKQEGDPILCENGFHFCRELVNCFSYYSFNSTNKVAEIEVLGDIIGDPNDKECSCEIKIVKEISWFDVLKMCNTGKDNSGNSNSGDSNSGDRNSGNSNSGNWNSGDSNSGNSNSGDRNSGDSNSGDWNSGYWNSGDRNSGNSNSGYWNSGNWNSGYWNSGYWNSGNSNSGNSNSGNSNSGNWNSGDSNSGNSNSGNRNSGDSNSGDWNSGYWNSTNHESGYFNSIQSEYINIFNKPCKRTDWENANKPDFIYFDLCIWISFDSMSEQEKIDYPKAYVCDGYLKKYEYKEAWKLSYKKASKEDIKLLKALPNFDSDVFEQISGIKIK